MCEEAVIYVLLLFLITSVFIASCCKPRLSKAMKYSTWTAMFFFKFPRDAKLMIEMLTSWHSNALVQVAVEPVVTCFLWEALSLLCQPANPAALTLFRALQRSILLLLLQNCPNIDLLFLYISYGTVVLPHLWCALPAFVVSRGLKQWTICFVSVNCLILCKSLVFTIYFSISCWLKPVVNILIK